MSKFVEDKVKVVGKKVKAGLKVTAKWGAHYWIKPYSHDGIELSFLSDNRDAQVFHSDDLNELIADLTAIRDALKG